jgi:4-hydroxy-tetrahydrodipicolinate synthase
MNAVLHGMVPMLVTPLTDDGALDLPSLRRLVAQQIEAGTDGLGILGLAGEGIYLSLAEREQVTQTTLDAVGSVPVLVGCTADTTEEAVRLAAGAARRGATEVMVAPPRRPDWTREQFREHYRAVADAAGSACSVMVQDAPFAIGVELGVEMVLELAAEMPNVRSYKIEALPFWENAVRAQATAGDALRIYGGHGGLYLMDVLDAGSHGLIPGCDTTAALVRAWRAYQAGDRDQASAVYLRLLPFLVFEAQSIAVLVGGAKEILARREVIASTYTRLPGATLSSATRDRLLELADSAGLLG